MSTEIRRWYRRTHTDVRSGTHASFRACKPDIRAYGVNFTVATPAVTWDQDSPLKSGSLKKVAARYVQLTAIGGCARVRLGAGIGISGRPTA